MTTSPAPATERFTSDFGDWWTCPCGNHPGEIGHGLARADGTPDDDDPDWMVHQTLTCLGCGRFGRATERNAETGEIPVRGRVSRALLARCNLDTEPVPGALREVETAVAGGRSALVAESQRVTVELPTLKTVARADARSRKALADENLAYACKRLIAELTSAGDLLRVLRRM